MSKLWFVVMPIVLGIAATIATHGAGAESFRELLAAPALVGDGRWRESAATPAAAPKRWALEVRNDGGALSGVVEIGGSPLVTRAALTGRVEGEGVWGTLRDERGREVATFTGRVTPDGRLHGRYQDRNGEAGTWEWERPRAVAPGER